MELILGDRRADRRYDIELPMRYRLLRGSRVLFEGQATTATLSRSGFAFRSGRFLPSGLMIEAYIDWPVILRGCEAVTLRINGRIVRSDGDLAVVRNTWHEFVREESAANSETIAEAVAALAS
jgi:hypothetical protein